MSRRGVATSDGASVEVKCPDRLWMTIRRADGRKEPRFARLAGKDFGVIEIGILVPNWRVLSRTRMQDSDLSSGLWSAHHGDYRISIYGDPGFSVWHTEVMGLWRRFMGIGGEFMTSIANQPRFDSSLVLAKAELTGSA